MISAFMVYENLTGLENSFNCFPISLNFVTDDKTETTSSKESVVKSAEKSDKPNINYDFF